MILISADQIERALPMRDAVDECARALALHASGGANVPLRTNLDVPEHAGQALFMPAYVGEADALGIKIVSVYPGNANKGLPAVPAQVLMLDASIGIVTAVLEGTSLTRIRTGAVQGAATAFLAREDARVGALIGPGGQAASQLEAMLTVRDLEIVRETDIDLERAKTFAAAQSERLAHFNARIEAVPSAEDAVPEADVIAAVTVARDAVFDGDMVKAGAHVNGVGSYTPQMAELPERLMARADIVTIDTEDCLAEAGDIINPIQNGILREQDCFPLGRLLSGEIAGRTTPEQITVFDTVGVAVLDIVCGQRVLASCVEQGLGTEIDL